MIFRPINPTKCPHCGYQNGLLWTVCAMCKREVIQPAQPWHHSEEYGQMIRDDELTGDRL